MKRTFSLPIFLLLLSGCGSASKAPAAYEPESVNVGYGSLERREVSTSVSKVETNDVDNLGYANIFEYLEGRVPGLLITWQGDSATINIRGAVSFYGNTEPLFVVDGQVVDRIDDVNPREVKSVEVLKDGGAAIYGSRGANGVILITLKK